MADIDGFFAVSLWEEYQRIGNRKALETLLAYDIQDTVTLESLMVTTYNLKLRQTSFHATHLIEAPSLPVNPFSADLATVEKIKHGWSYLSQRCWY